MYDAPPSWVTMKLSLASIAFVAAFALLGCNAQTLRRSPVAATQPQRMANVHPDPVRQMLNSGLPAEEQNLILIAVFSAIVSELHASDHPAYLRVGDADPSPEVIDTLRRKALPAMPHSRQPKSDGRGDGIAGTDVRIDSFERTQDDVAVIEVGVMGGILAGNGWRFTLSRVEGVWKIKKQDVTWIS